MSTKVYAHAQNCPSSGPPRTGTRLVEDPKVMTSKVCSPYMRHANVPPVWHLVPHVFTTNDFAHIHNPEAYCVHKFPKEWGKTDIWYVCWMCKIEIFPYILVVYFVPLADWLTLYHLVFQEKAINMQSMETSVCSKLNASSYYELVMFLIFLQNQLCQKIWRGYTNCSTVQHLNCWIFGEISLLLSCSQRTAISYNICVYVHVILLYIQIFVHHWVSLCTNVHNVPFLNHLCVEHLPWVQTVSILLLYQGCIPLWHSVHLWPPIINSWVILLLSYVIHLRTKSIDRNETMDKAGNGISRQPPGRK